MKHFAVLTGALVLAGFAAGVAVAGVAADLLRRADDRLTGDLA